METDQDLSLLEPFDKTYLGQTLPRIHTPILDLPSRGNEVIDLANRISMPLMPWQAHVISEATKYHPDTMKPAHKTNALLISRQSGKTHLLRMRILAGLFLWDEKLIIATAQNRDIALETFQLSLLVMSPKRAGSLGHACSNMLSTLFFHLKVNVTMHCASCVHQSIASAPQMSSDFLK